MCRTNLRLFCEDWRFWIRPLLIIIYVIFAIIVVPLLIVNSLKDGSTGKNQLILIGGLFVLSAVPISLWHIVQHVIHFTKPILQKHIIRILWMVPIYAMNAWMGLCFPKHSIYVDSLRECYEAYVIYNFMVYLLHYLNLGMDLEATMEYKPQVNHFFPLCCMRPWTMGREFIHNCKHGILQYTIVRPITTFISVICQLCGVYGEGTFAGNVAFPYIVVVNNISQFVAMYCLVLFYRANKEDLKPMKPIPKFLCIKAVVFFSFFQGVLLNILVYYEIIKNIFEDSDNNLAAMLQNFLICIEMFVAAVAHIYSFPHYPFHINSPQYWNNPNHNWCRAFLSMIDLTDMQEDVQEHLGVVSSSITRRFQGRSTYQPLSRGPRRLSSENEYLINKRQDGGGSSNSNSASGGGGGSVAVSGDGSDTAAVLVVRPSTSKRFTSPTSQKFAHIPHSNFEGINRQNSDFRSSSERVAVLPSHHSNAADSLLQARNVNTSTTSTSNYPGYNSLIPETPDDDFDAFIGVGASASNR